jgi:hypothetical protein
MKEKEYSMTYKVNIFETGLYVMLSSPYKFTVRIKKL